jgi:lysophospholipid acyltransferase (LPLAT)-like uncharacterized protein
MKKLHKKLLKNSKVVGIVLGSVGYLLTILLKMTIRFKRGTHPEYNKKQQYIFCFWHGQQMMPLLQIKQHKTPFAALVSPSTDGNILQAWLKCLGCEVVRGSSRAKNILGLKAMMSKIDAGVSIGFGVDGPIGPIYKVKPGMTYMAQKLGIAIVPVGSCYSNKWVFNKAWDKFELPKPFAKAGFYLGKPFVVDKNADLKQANLELETMMQQVAVNAKALI